MSEDPQLDAEHHETVDEEAINDVTEDAIQEDLVADAPGWSEGD